MKVVVPDDTDRTKQTLIGLTTRPVLVSDPASGYELTEILRRHGLDPIPTSDVSVDVYGDNELVVADSALTSIVTDDRQWIVTVTALVADLKSGPFTRHTEQSIRQIVERLRTLKIVRADEVRLVLGGEEMPPPAQMTCLPIEDDDAPTVVVWPTGLAVLEELERCAASIAYLVGQPQLADALQLVFTRLGKICPSLSTALTDEVLARALQVGEDQVRESRSGLRGPLVGFLERTRVLVAYFGGAQQVAVFDLKTRDVGTDLEVLAVLDAMQEFFPLPTSELAHQIQQHGRLADLRDALGLDFVRFNEALISLEPPHPPLRHPDRHENALAGFVDGHEDAILSRLREAYRTRALDRQDLAAYGEARGHHGLVPDPEWLDRFAEPPEEVLAERVRQWLAAHGASTDLDRPGELPPVKELRTRNFEVLDQVVQDAEPRVRAWCRKHGQGVPPGWNSPVSEARSALEASYLADFSYLPADQLLDVVADSLGWPATMPQLLDLGALGLDASELLSREQADADDRRRRQQERTHLKIDGREVPVDVDSLGRLADAVASSLTEDILAQSGKVFLAQISRQSEPRRPVSGSGLTVARHPGMSDAQRTAVGLVGEVVARAWLERRYSNVAWVSGYRNIVLGDGEGSDSRGYDFEVRDGSRNLYFEVKALVGDPGDLAEFELGETEVIAAQRHRVSYRILLVCGVLDATSRQIFELPNPLGPRGVGRYALLGRGLRYRCALQR